MKTIPNIRFVRAPILTLLLLIFGLPADANDGIGALGAGGVITFGKTDAVSMRKEVLEIGTSRINVSYEFLNESDNDVTLPIVFPIPLYGGGDLPSNEYGGQPPKFSLLIDGVTQPFLTTVRALYQANRKAEARDVTDSLEKIGLTPGQIALLPGAFQIDGVDMSRFDSKRITTVPKLSETQLKQLRKLGFLSVDPSGRDPDKKNYPDWKVQVSYHWNVTFPKGKTVTVSHSYSPFLGLGSSGDMVDNGATEKEQQKYFCATPTAVRKLLNAAQGKPIPGAVVSYILTTANTWKGPIADFTLRIKKTVPDEVVSLCFPGKFTRVDTLTLESHLQDFVPERELLIQFLDPSNGNSKGLHYKDSDGVAPQGVGTRRPF